MCRLIFQIIPSEIEEIANQHQKVELSHCIAVPDDKRGKVPIICVTLNKKSKRSELRLQKIETLIKFYVLNKVENKKIYIERVLALEAFPKTSDGTVDVARIQRSLIFHRNEKQK